MSQADEPSYAELKRLYAELVLECAAAKDRNVAYRLQIQEKANKNMTYTEKQLKQALAQMLPETLCYQSPRGADGLYWRVPSYAGLCRSVSDTELLHVCHLVEQTLTSDEWNKFKNAFEELSSRSIFPINFTHATWQHRVVALTKVKGIEV